MPESIPPKLYLNENITIHLVGLLKTLGIESIHTEQVHNKGVNDEFQLQYAAQKSCILVTHNRRHFRRLHNEWVKDDRKHCGILVMGQNEPEYLAKRIKSFFDQEYNKLTPSFCAVPPVV